MKITHLTVFSKILILFSNISIAQDVSDKQAASFGIDFNMRNFSKNYPLIPGVGVNYTSGLSANYNYSIVLSGAFLDSAKKSYKQEDKKLFIESSFHIIRKLANPASKYQPFMSGGVGFGYYNKYWEAYIPLGVGLQARINSDIFTTINLQYHFSTTSTLNSHYFLSFGVAGILNKRKSPTVKNTNSRSYRKQIVLPVYAPDRDHDGIVDSADACPDIAGTLINSGCPSIKNADPSIESMLDSLAKNILFETNSAVLKPASHPSLDEVVKILIKHPTIILLIEGHTDDVGSEENNQLLSTLRANSVVNYLNQKGGILQIRLQPFGFGETKPLESNDTPAGRAVNRRVELKIKTI